MQALKIANHPQHTNSIKVVYRPCSLTLDLVQRQADKKQTSVHHNSPDSKYHYHLPESYFYRQIKMVEFVMTMLRHQMGHPHE